VLTTVLDVLVAVGAGLVGGVFLAFSAAVMPALRRRPPAEGAAVMREVNRVILNPVFLGVFLGTAVASAAVLLVGDLAGRIAGLLYLLGSFGVTIAANVPLNNRLDAEGEPVWAHYLTRWTAWNHARTVACAAAAVLAAL